MTATIIHPAARKLIDAGHAMQVIAGEGTGPSDPTPYTGKRTDRAINSRITHEASHGDRWAWCEVYSHETKCDQRAWMNVTTGELS